MEIEKDGEANKLRDEISNRGRITCYMSLGRTKHTKWCVPNKDLDEPGHLPSLISLHCLPEEGLGPWLPKKHTAKTDQTGQMPRLIWVFIGSSCYSPALKMLGLYWICPVVPSFCHGHSVIIQMKLEYLWGQLANLDQILYKASLGWGKGCIRFWDRLDQNSGFHGNRKRPLTY